MAEEYGFFDSTESDIRYYSAGNFNGLASLLFTDGVIGDSSSLYCTSRNFTVTIQPGGAFVGGYWYKNSSALDLTTTAPATTRYDRVVLRLSLVNKTIKAVYRKGSASSYPSLYNTSNYVEISLAKLLVASNQIISVTDDRTFATFRGGT